jgi:hypothetical protein
LVKSFWLCPAIHGHRCCNQCACWWFPIKVKTKLANCILPHPYPITIFYYVLFFSQNCFWDGVLLHNSRAQSRFSCNPENSPHASGCCGSLWTTGHPETPEQSNHSGTEKGHSHRSTQVCCGGCQPTASDSLMMPHHGTYGVHSGRVGQ